MECADLNALNLTSALGVSVSDKVFAALSTRSESDHFLKVCIHVLICDNMFETVFQLNGLVPKPDRQRHWRVYNVLCIISNGIVDDSSLRENFRRCEDFRSS